MRRWRAWLRARWTDRSIDPLTAPFADLVRLRMDRDRHPLLPVLADKLRVKDWARARGVATAAVIWEGRRGQPIPWDDLPPSCYVKTNHGSGWNLRCDGGHITLFQDGKVPESQRRVLTRSRAQALVDSWLRRHFSPREWAYKPIPRRVFVEAPLIDRTADELQDYRFYVFAGQVKAANLGSPTLRQRSQVAAWYADGRPWVLTQGRELLVERPLPSNWDALKQMAETLAAGLDFVRVDLYDTTEGIVLGEMTLYPEAGGPDTPTACPVFNQWLGDCWREAWQELGWVPGRWRPQHGPAPDANNSPPGGLRLRPADHRDR